MRSGLPIVTGAWLKAGLAALVVLCTLSVCGAHALADPTPVGAVIWSPLMQVDPSVSGVTPEISGLACPSDQLCVGVDSSDGLLTSNDPTGGATDWKLATVFSGVHNGGGQVSCPSTSLCLASDNGRQLMYSTDPAAGASSWKLALTAGATDSVASVACAPAAAVCIAATSSGALYTSTDPAAGPSSWEQTISFNIGLFAASTAACPSASLCVVATDNGSIASSTNPTVASSWISGNAPSEYFDGGQGLPTFADGIACPTTKWCLLPAQDSLYEGAPPTTIATDWTNLGGPTSLDGAIACASVTLCAIGDSGGGDIASTNVPLSVSIPWTVTPVPGLTFVDAATCTSDLCVMGDSDGSIVTGAPAEPLLVEVTGPGGVHAGTFSCITDTCVADYAPKSVVTLTPDAAPGNYFAGWGGDCSGTGACTVTMSTVRLVTAKFGPKPGFSNGQARLSLASTRVAFSQSGLATLVIHNTNAFTVELYSTIVRSVSAVRLSSSRTARVFTFYSKTGFRKLLAGQTLTIRLRLTRAETKRLKGMHNVKAEFEGVAVAPNATLGYSTDALSLAYR